MTNQAQQNAITKAMDTNKAFFAFGDQLKEQINKFEKGTKFVSFGAGLYCPKLNAQQFKTDYKVALQVGKPKTMTKKEARKIINKAYFNFESMFSDNNEDLKDYLQEFKTDYPKQFTEELIQEEITNCWNYAIKEDLF